MDQNKRTLYGGGPLLTGNAELTLLGINKETPVVLHVPGHKLLGVITNLSEKFNGIKKATGIFCWTPLDGQNVHWMLFDGNMRIEDTLPVDKCWDAIEKVGRFVPIVVHQAA